ncbi:DUF5719 family protein [Marmoricola sp. RAF53]|uniref:DUF5719 family protein n=1 Tax=Marmoricola sp. RAF53 TaxID=3233059 RepID=UPI003F963CEE
MSSRSARGRARGSAVLGIMVVALTAGLLALAGTTPEGIGAPVAPAARVELDQRTFVCTGNLPGTSVTQGSVVGGPQAPKPASGPVVIDVDRREAATAYAAQAASAPLWAAWLPCPEAHARWWFVGVGGAAVTHDTVLSISNPRDGAAVLDIDVYGPDGPVTAPGLKGVIVPAGGHQELDLAQAAPGVGELAVRVVAQRGLVAISAADRYSPRAVGKDVREWVPPQSLPATAVTLVGLPDKPSGSTLVVVNPGQREAIAQVEVIGATGTFAPEKVPTLTIPPQSVTTLPLTSVFDGTAVAVRVSSEQRVTATVRSVQGGDIAYATGVRPVRGTTAFAVPQGTRRELALSSLGAAGAVTMTTYDEAGRQLASQVQTVKAGTTLGIVLGPRVRSVQLTSATATTVAGLFGTAPQGITAGGISPALRSIRLPVVRQGW